MSGRAQQGSAEQHRKPVHDRASRFRIQYAAKIWQNGAVSWPDVGRPALGWTGGITLYVFSLKYMQRLGVTSAEVQTAVWQVGASARQQRVDLFLQ
jgi:hypothetical protein